ncbi:hypothetical protein [cf. Phormidesmis sp. LEGE 11477]|uniref:hypothetical protein n=1 Tax=cf. Phormidesmis sp. LEGE 11477 TaxID=1828680 RepID=UPI00187E6B9B|nr:hypothetical protein [cf. Phormidesmis sp. LEGE 11477]MBE9064029.1 hypothetical protein [cf. Phormidesmis sp. LEGE 11477]
MQSITVRSHVGADGILHLELPVAVTEQDLEVTVLYQPVQTDSQHQSSESLGYSPNFFEETAGAWQGEPLVRGEQGECDRRHWDSHDLPA